MRHIPNIISIFRILLVPCILLLLDSPWGFRLFFLCGWSDLADGYLARRFHWQSKLGSYLDPIADKLLMSSLYIALTMRGVFPFWLCVLVLVIGDDAGGDADFLAELGLCEAPALADGGESFAEAFESSFFHCDLCEEFQKDLQIVGAASKTG